MRNARPGVSNSPAGHSTHMATDPHAPPPDGGEPQGSKDDRPAMLGRRFRLAEVVGMTAGLVIALIIHAVAVDGANGWSWAVFAVLGAGVGGAGALFLYGTATDRSDTGGDQPHGRADVGTRGEWRRTIDRRRKRDRGAPRVR
jgi:hypothetical protein